MAGLRMAAEPTTVRSLTLRSLSWNGAKRFHLACVKETAMQTAIVTKGSFAFSAMEMKRFLVVMAA
eukprot:scaffold25_cov54-Cylindrotheca_fusiformis.AAC.1